MSRHESHPTLSLKPCLTVKEKKEKEKDITNIQYFLFKTGLTDQMLLKKIIIHKKYK